MLETGTRMSRNFTPRKSHVEII